MAGVDVSIRSRDVTEVDCPVSKKPKIETEEDADTEVKPNPQQNFIVFKGRKIHIGEPEDQKEYWKQVARFGKQLEDSEGFDVDWDSFDFKFNVVNFDWGPPLDDQRSNEELMQVLIQKAIEEHDEEHDTKLGSAEYVSANIGGCRGYLYYITFSAIDLNSSNQERKLYQARVLTFCDDITVRLVRLKPTQ